MTWPRMLQVRTRLLRKWAQMQRIRQMPMWPEPMPAERMRPELTLQVGIVRQ